MRGGKREGAGRKKAIIAAGFDINYTEAQQKVWVALPKMIDVLVTLASEGDRDAAKYLVDRALGKPTEKTVQSFEDDEKLEIVIKRG